MRVNAFATDGLKKLHTAFETEGFTLYFVGGMVRDLILGHSPKDVDLTTSASPDEQVEVYEKHGFSYHLTGLQHGTITVIVDGEPTEITSMRTENAHDGRHATVQYVKDLNVDLARRDLTFNAMALDFDGNLHDPFGGKADLLAGRVRFVGSAKDRMVEDYLRILRWVRFHGRFGKGAMDQEAFNAADQVGHGLKSISRERIWSEVQKIICLPNGPDLMGYLSRFSDHIDLPLPKHCHLRSIPVDVDVEPVVRVAAFTGYDEDMVGDIARNWKWSNDEGMLGKWVARERKAFDGDFVWMLAYREIDPHYVIQLAKTMNLQDEVYELTRRKLPVCPVRGGDIAKMGIRGKDVGMLHEQVRLSWARSDYRKSFDELIAEVKSKMHIE